MIELPQRIARRPLFTADWRNAAFIHFTINPGILRPFVPLELDLLEDTAWVSLVAFTQVNLRPAIGGRIGQLLAAPLATHEFLNLRTYVRHGGTQGIYFLAEWIPNRLAALIGPRTYGLPYRLGRLSYRFDFEQGRVDAAVRAQGAVRFRGAFDIGTAVPAIEHSREAFLLERYVAFTYRNGRLRRFDVAHAPWPQRRLDAQVMDLSLLASVGAWTNSLRFIGAHVSRGVQGVTISAPQAVWPMERPDVPSTA